MQEMHIGQGVGAVTIVPIGAPVQSYPAFEMSNVSSNSAFFSHT